MSRTRDHSPVLRQQPIRPILRVMEAALHESPSPSPPSAPTEPGPFVCIQGNTIQQLQRLWRDPAQMLLESHHEVGRRAELKLATTRYFSISDPRDVRHVLVTQQHNYTKSKFYRGLMLALGRGLVTSEGTRWKRQRKLAQPAFHPRQMPNFLPMMERCTREMLATWRPGEALDVHQAMTNLTFRIIGFALLNRDLSEDADSVGRALGSALEYVAEYTERMLPFPSWVPTPGMRRFNRDLAVLDGIVLKAIDDRREQQKRGEQTPSDLLNMLMSATDEHGQMSDQQLRDELITMVSAGHETTANGLAWTFMFLSQHPAVAARVQEEVRRVVGEGPIDTEVLSKLEYTERVLKESMRLRPPVWVVERQAILEDQLDGATIDPGQVIAISSWVLHRDPDVWENPEGFDPDRFLPEQDAKRPRYSYLPFGAGPRVCIGAAFAMMEAKLILALVSREHRLELVAGQTLKPDFGITLRPADGVRVRVRVSSS